MKIAFLGTGLMGRELARHLLDDGHELTVWNRTASAAESLVKNGAHPAENPQAAVGGADAVLTVLFGPDAVREVVIDPPLPIKRGAVWIDITTVSPADATSFTAWAAEHGVHYAHSPVIGSLAPARARALGVLLGGDDEAVAGATPIVSTWAAPDRLRVYESAAKAATGKLVANLAVAVAMQGFVEALRLGHSGGMTTDEVITALDRTPLSMIKDLKAANVRDGRFDDTQFSADLLSKDTRLITQTSEYPLPALTAAYEALESARNAGRGDDDFAVIAADSA